MERLINEKACLCYKEIDECVAYLEDELVLQDTSTAQACITKHPVFDTIYLDK